MLYEVEQKHRLENLADLDPNLCELITLHTQLLELILKRLVIAKKFDDKFYIGLITKKKGDLWHVEYEDGNKEDSDAIEVQKGIQLYYFALDIDGKPSELLL